MDPRAPSRRRSHAPMTATRSQDNKSIRTKSFHLSSVSAVQGVVALRSKSDLHDRYDDKENHCANQNNSMEKNERDLLIQKAILEHRVEREKIQKRVLQSRQNETSLNKKLATALKELQRIEQDFENFRRGANHKLEEVLQENKRLKRKLTMKHTSIALEADELASRSSSPSSVLHQAEASSTPRITSAEKPPKYVKPSSRTQSDMPRTTSLFAREKRLSLSTRRRPATVEGVPLSDSPFCSRLEVDRLESDVQKAVPRAQDRAGLSKSQSAYNHRRPRIRISSFRSGSQRRSFERRTSFTQGSQRKSKRASLGARASIMWPTSCFEGS